MTFWNNYNIDILLHIKLVIIYLIGHFDMNLPELVTYYFKLIRHGMMIDSVNNVRS